ncbi:hypothetical protein AHAS_Ahas20G0175000 [Arachis hypogaea]
MRRPQEANLSWVVEFYTNYFSPSLQTVFIRRKQVLVSEKAIQEVLRVPPIPDEVDGYQEALRQRDEFNSAFDWDAVRRVFAELEIFWTRGRLRPRPKGILERYLTVDARAWTQILSHYVFPRTHETLITANLALLVWCILTEQLVNIARLIHHTLGRVLAKGNLPFLALVTELVATAGVPQEAKDRKAMIPVEGDVVPTKNYLKPPAEHKTFDIVAPSVIATTSSTSQGSSQQRLEDLHKKIDRYERQNQRRYAYIKKLLSCMTPSIEEPEISTSTSYLSEESTHERDSGSSKPDHSLNLASSTENHANS